MRLRKRITGLFFCSVSFFACVTTDHKLIPKLFPSVEKNRSHESYTGVSKEGRGMVVAAHPLATKAGKQMLEVGGNAVDAAVAASFVISVTRPHSTGLGGGGFLVFHDPRKQQSEVIDFRERAPSKASRTMFINPDGTIKKGVYKGASYDEPSVNGHLSVAVPGLVKGLCAVHAKYGKLSLKQVIEPAVKAAEDGFAVYPTLAEALDDRKELLAMFPGSKAIFFKGDRVLKLGETLVQKDLAKSLQKISLTKGEDFYKGDIAKKIILEMQRGGGLITDYDLSHYALKSREPLEATINGYRFVTMPPPSSGGVHLIQMLKMLEKDDLPTLYRDQPKYWHLLAEVMRRAFADRAKYMGDPDFVNVPVKSLIASSYINQLRNDVNLDHVVPSTSLKNAEISTSESESTTHISVVDADGQAVSTTQTINYWFGSGVVAEGTGILLNNEMDDFSISPGKPNVFGLIQGEGNAIAPGKTPLSSMTPTIVLNEDGSVKLVVGSPGGPKIISAVFQVTLNHLQLKMPLLEANHSLRIHHQWFPDVMSFEGGLFSDQSAQVLREKGHILKQVDSIGDVQAISRNSDHSLVGVADSRSEGVALGL